MTESYKNRFADKDSAKEYDEIYKAGDSYASIIYDIEKKILDKILENEGGATRDAYLDFATGTGRIISHLEAKFNSSDGVDISAEMINICAEKVQISNLECVDITTMHNEKKYSFITAFRFFLNAEPALRLTILDALSARLSSNGLMVVNNHGRKCSVNFLGNLKRKVQGKASKQTILSDTDFENLFRQFDLSVVSKYGYGVLGGKLSRLLGINLSRKIENYIAGTFMAEIFGTCVIYVLKQKPEF